MNKPSLHRIVPVLGLLLFLGSLWILHHLLQEYHYRDVIQSLGALAPGRIWAGLLLTTLSYLLLIAYDLLALRYIGQSLSYGKTVLTSFVAHVFSHNVGLNVLGGGAIRYRFYSNWGLSAIEVSKIVGFCTLTFWVGFLTVGGTVFLMDPFSLPVTLHLPFETARSLGIPFLGLAAAYLLVCLVRKSPFQFRGWEISVPSGKVCLLQFLVSSLDWIFAGSVFFMLLPSSPSLSFTAVLALFTLAQLAGMVSHIPGGLGVFESVVLLLLPKEPDTSSVLAALLVYRGIYYLLPFVLAAVLLGLHELLERKEKVRGIFRFFGQWTPPMVPSVLALTTALAGLVLLFSGVTPSIGTRLNWLNRFLPLHVVEVSHFLGSLTGVGLLILARGIQQRLDAAYFLTAILLAAGILFSLLKGLDYEEAMVLGFMLGALLPARRHFYRKASLISERFTPGWSAALLVAVSGSIWLGIFSYKHVEYSNDLWWQFTLQGDISRFLRASVGMVVAVLLFSAARLLRPVPAEPGLPSAADLDRADTIVGQSERTSTRLALLGDKHLLFNETGTAFLMYGTRGQTWVSLGDPVGPEAEMADLVWRFRELCDRHGARTVFYQVDPDHLSLYLDLGLTLIKIGEEARVPLGDFSLEGGSRRGVRHTFRQVERAGCTFGIVPIPEVPALLPEMKTVSASWLSERNASEKRFSLGFFDEAYLRRFPAAVVKKENRVVAFCNVLTGAGKEELSVDLMRFLPDAPAGVMEYLFIQLMLWGRQEGYRWFNLGMSPLAGFESHPLAPLWSRVGAFIFRHGEHFYHFKGLREYKDKFDPLWEPKYLAAPGGLSLPRVLSDITILIAGGVKGVVAN